MVQIFDKVLLLVTLFLISISTLLSQEDFVPLFHEAKIKTKSRELYSGIDDVRHHEVILNNLAKNNDLVIPSRVRFNLFEDITIDVNLEKVNKHYYKGLEVYRGKSTTSKFDHLPNYHDVIVVYNPNTKLITAQLHCEEGVFEINPTENINQYRITEWPQDGFQCHGGIKHQHGAQPTGKSNGCNEQDKDGKYVADLFIGYSYKAAEIANDIDAHALSLTEMVNNGLTNSLVDEVYVRLVGVGLHPRNDGIVTSVLSDVWNWFASEIALTGADYVAAIQTPTGAIGEVGGWAGVGGYSSVNSINGAAAVFRHELGHNIGSSHCTPGILPYAAGYDNGNVKTHMCGNNVNFYSTPLVNDNTGLPLGNAQTADNARVWKERAPIVSGRLKHTILYDEFDTGCTQPITAGRYHIQNVNSDKYLASLNGSNSNGTAVVQVDNMIATGEWDLVPVSTQEYRLVHVSSGRLLDVPGSSSSSGTNLIIWNSHGNANQVYKISEVNTDEYTIQTFNEQCVQVEGGGTNNNDPVEQNNCSSGLETLWKFVPVSGANVFSVSVATTDADCFGQPTGSATAVGSGGSGNYTYTWSNGSTGNTVTNLQAGHYIVTVNDGTDMVPFSFAIKQESGFDINTSITPDDTSNTGSISVSVDGGTAPYTFAWSNGATTQNLMNVQAGLYNVTITDATGCSNEKQALIGCSESYKPCDDSNPLTINDVYDTNCNCSGKLILCQSGLSLVNMAQEKTTTQSSNQTSAQNAVDGIIDSQLDTGDIAITDSETTPWWEVDLGEIIDIEGILITNRVDCCEGRLRNYYVFVSDVPFTSTDIDTTLAQSGVWSQLYDIEPLPDTLITPNITGRYIRTQLNNKTSAGRLNLVEVQVFGCGIPVGRALVSNPLSNTLYELKGNVQPNGQTINSITLEHGEGAFLHSIPIDTTGISSSNIFNISELVDIQNASSYQFRITLISSQGTTHSNTYTFEPKPADYCNPTSNTNLWYKRFSKVEINNFSYTDSGNSNYEDNSNLSIGEFQLDTKDTISLSTPSSGWHNLTFIVYVDLNNDNDFDDYNEQIGFSTPNGQTTEVELNFPKENVVINQDLRIRILGNESGGYNSCFTPIGNFKDFSIRFTANSCQGSGHLEILHVDNDGDGFGAIGNGMLRNCHMANNGYSHDNTDFDDNDWTRYPNAPELCDNIDNDNDGLVDEGAIYDQAQILFVDENIPTDTYSASQLIKATQSITNPSSDVRFFSGNSIELEQGFEVPLGSTFRAFIVGGCGN